jgi:hypothetical protein
MVLGNAIYRHPMLVTNSHPQPDFDSFWGGSAVADGKLRHRYLAWLRHESLKLGDFYSKEGMAQACQSVLETMTQDLQPRRSATDEEMDMAAC